MVQQPSVQAISQDELKNLLHRSEDSRYLLALLTSLAVLAFTLYVISQTGVAFLIVIAVVVFGVWFATQILQARLIGNAARVSPLNFPEMYRVLEGVKQRLDYKEPVHIYVVESGDLNGFLYRFFRTRFIVLNSELVTAMMEQGDLMQLTWIVARFVGSLKTKHLRLEYIRLLIGALQGTGIFNFLLLPYERATQYSGDQIGLALCGDLGQAHLAMLKFVAGKDLAQHVNPWAFIVQASEIRHTFFGWYSQIFQRHPHWTNRYLNLLDFTQKTNRAHYDSYLLAHGIDPLLVDKVLSQGYAASVEAPAVTFSMPPRQRP